MNRRVFDLLLQMLQLRKEREMAQSRRVQAEYQRVKSFSDQISGYAREYEEQWTNTARLGGTVLDLQAQSDFGRRLHATAQSQAPEVNALDLKRKAALEQALRAAERAKALERWIQRRKLESRQDTERAQEKEQEDALQARHRRL